MDTTETSHVALYPVPVSKSARDFKGQSSSARSEPQIIVGNTVEEWKYALVEFCRPQCIREIIVSEVDPKFKFSDDSTPQTSDLHKFIVLYDCKKTKYRSLQQITSSMLQKWREDSVLAIVHRYSQSISNSKLWQAAEKALFSPASSDRAGAPDMQAVLELVHHDECV
ncbi:unnamed protein product [Aphanomyces euteiches]